MCSSPRWKEQYLLPIFYCNNNNHDSRRYYASINNDEQHIAKQLSRYSDKAKEMHKTWLKVADKLNTNAQHEQQPIIGLEHFNYTTYEDKALKEIHDRSFDANILLEIRDVRVPASSHHPSFTRLAKHRTHIICYTHADLIDKQTRDKVEQWTKCIWPKSESVFVDTRGEGQNRKDEIHRFDNLLHLLLETIDKRGGNLCALTVGVSNVGKSSVLASLIQLGRERKILPKTKVQIRPKTKTKSKGRQLQKASMPAVQDTPGKTRYITEYLLRDKPRTYFMDVPGITPPPFYFKERPYSWYGFGATNLLPLGKPAKDDIALQKSFCSYVLSCANRDRVFHYVDKLNLSNPTDDIDDVLSQLCNSRKWVHLDEHQRCLKRCENFLKLYNTGNLGSIVLDDMKDTSWKPFTFHNEYFSGRIGKDDRAGQWEEDEHYSKNKGQAKGQANRRQSKRALEDKHKSDSNWRDNDEWFQTK